MKILMMKTVQGSLDGVTVHELKAGTEYDTVDSPRGDRLAKYHIKQGVAVPALGRTGSVLAPEPKQASRKK
ncbi:hypothetical protein CR152_30050 [Massilia violaceinigra]|uniref:Uncharacterized protein n=1 Tax=Massilia violaceinigra TaxID=2045208 RepID=A0A2D2DTH8_9BURK|nr:hypothetical protein [Massilia violaceinigra]ATQ78280.1 hypothetical protein CR152_30050 [Massilia violaceinigra]